MHSSASAPCLTRRPLLKGGTALLGLDYEETLQILRHQQRVENMKPSAAVQRQEQERNFQRHRRFVQIRSRYAQPTSPAPAHSSGRLPESGNRRDFEKRLERMLLQDWDGKEQDFAWKRCPPKEQRVPISRPRVREVAQGAEASAVSEAVPASESMTEPNETQRSEAARNETSDMQQGKGLEKDDTLKQKEAEAQVTNSYAGFGNPGASGGAKPGHLSPPDFRSILQSDNASSGPGASLDSGGNGLGGFGADAGMNLKPPNFQMQTDTSSALNAGAAIPSLSQQNDFASGPALKPLHSADEVPESIGGFGEQAAGGVGGGGLSRERRMRPPDFRSILQSDNASSGPSEPVPFGNQGNDGGLVLKPLGSLNGGGNGLGGFGADAGMNLKPSNFQMQTDTSSALNAGAAIPSLSQQNDFASGPALKPLHSADEVPESIGGFGSDFAGPGAIKSTAGPVSDFFKEENGYVPSVAAAGRRRRPRAGQL